MKKLAAITLAAVLPALALAATFEGVTMPDKVDVAGKSLALNGMGLRTKLFFKVYVAALYVETPSKDPNAIVTTDQVKSVKMSMLRDLSKEQIAEAIREGFEKNAKAQLPQLKERLDKFIAQIPNVKKGEVLELTYVPGSGTTATSKTGGETAKIEGKDFADALFSVWLGKSPVDEDLKKGMLGTK
jgi:hypothetical protein